MARLAIFVPNIGNLSETFIRRQVLHLMPGSTVVITDAMANECMWTVDCPVLALKDLKYSMEGAARWLMRRRGLPVTDISRKAAERFLRKHRVEVILGQYLDQTLPYIDMANCLGIRCFGHAHGYDVSICLRNERLRQEYLKYNFSTGIVSMSEFTKKRLVDLGVGEEKIRVIPYGVDVPDEPCCRKQNEIVRCLAVGRMTAKKAPILTLDAFRRAVQLCPNLYLEYVGTGPLLAAAKQFVRAFGLKSRVRLHGGQASDTIARLMAEADIFLQHSMTDDETGDEEGLPVAILEAMSHALPVVSTLHAGIPEAVVDGITGYTVEEGDSVGMSQHIVNLARDIEVRRRMGLAGWERTKALFTWKKEKADLLKLMNLA